MFSMKARVLGLIVSSASLLSVGAQALEVCETLESCRAVRARVDARIAELESELPTLTAHGARGDFVFTRNTSIAALGDAWRDPSGMIWGDIVRNEDRSIRVMDQFLAFDYCLSWNPDSSERERIRAALEADKDPGRGVHLPRRADFVRLREYMGATTWHKQYSGANYTPQVLPNLYRAEEGRYVNTLFWSSSVPSDLTYLAHVFDGRTGYFVMEGRHYMLEAVRCVARR